MTISAICNILVVGLAFQYQQGQPHLSYDQGLVVAIEKKIPLVTFVGIKSRPIPNAIVVWKGELFGDPMPRIVISDPQYWIADLSCSSTDKEIQMKLETRRQKEEDAHNHSSWLGGAASPVFRSC